MSIASVRRKEKKLALIEMCKLKWNEEYTHSVHNDKRILKRLTSEIKNDDVHIEFEIKLSSYDSYADIASYQLMMSSERRETPNFVASSKISHGVFRKYKNAKHVAQILALDYFNI
jgi:hypothetical protein